MTALRAAEEHLALYRKIEGKREMANFLIYYELECLTSERTQ